MTQSDIWEWIKDDIIDNQTYKFSLLISILFLFMHPDGLYMALEWAQSQPLYNREGKASTSFMV